MWWTASTWPPVVHGTNVEDGFTLMGFLEMLGGAPMPPATSPARRRLGMDKYLMKAAMKQAGLPIAGCPPVHRRKAYALDSDGVMDQIEENSLIR